MEIKNILMSDLKNSVHFDFNFLIKVNKSDLRSTNVGAWAEGFYLFDDRVLFVPF